MKTFSKGFIDGYCSNEFDYIRMSSDSTYYADFHDGDMKRKVHELVINICGKLSIESFEENQKMALDVMKDW